jgi:hypothetical protein
MAKDQGPQPQTVPECPWCHSRKKVYIVPSGYQCLACDRIFDDQPDEGGDFSDFNPALRLQRAEARATRKERT